MKKLLAIAMLLIAIPAYADKTAVIGSIWKQEGTIAKPADDITGIDISGLGNYTGFPSAPGLLINRNYTSTVSVISTANIIPDDGTIPQITDGGSVFLLSITPKEIGSVIRVVSHIHATTNTVTRFLVCALFRDGAADAIDTGIAFGDASSKSNLPVIVANEFVSESTAEIVYELRCGVNISGTFYVNADAVGASRWGPTVGSDILIEEVLQ